MNKRILSIVLAILMLFTIVPMTILYASADNEVAMIVETGNKYDTFVNAFNACATGQTIKVLTDCAAPYLGGNASHIMGRTIDLDGHTLTCNEDRFISPGSGTGNWSVTIKNGILTNEGDDNFQSFAMVRGNSFVTFENMTIYECATARPNGYGFIGTITSSTGVINFKNCTINECNVNTTQGYNVSGSTVNMYNTTVQSYTSVFYTNSTYNVYSGTFTAVGDMDLASSKIPSTSTVKVNEPKKLVVECNHNYVDGYCEYCGVDENGNYPTDATVTTKATAPTISATTTTTTTKTTTSSTSSGSVDCYQISDVSKAANWQLGWWNGSNGLLESSYSGNTRAALNKKVQVKYGDVYILELKNNTIGIKYVLREYKQDGSFLKNFGTVASGGTYTPSSESVGFVSLTVYDNASAYSLISDGTIIPSMTAYVISTSQKFVFLYSNSSSDFEIDTNGHAYSYYNDYNNTGMQIRDLVAGQTLTFTSKASLESGIYAPTIYCRGYSGIAKVDVYINDIQVADSLDTSNVNGAHKAFALDSATISATGPVVIKFVTTSSGSFFPDDIVFEKTGNADPFKVNASMLKGASIRLSDTNGIRFYTQVDAQKVADLIAKGYTVEMGTLITPVDVLGDNELVLEENGVKKLNVKYEAKDTSGNFVYYENNNVFVGSVVNIKESDTSWSATTGNVTRKFVARGYIKVSKDGESKVNYADYADSDINNNTRSLQQVASAYKNDANSNYALLNDEYKEFVDNWASCVK